MEENQERRYTFEEVGKLREQMLKIQEDTNRKINEWVYDIAHQTGINLLEQNKQLKYFTEPNKTICQFWYHGKLISTLEINFTPLIGEERING